MNRPSIPALTASLRRAERRFDAQPQPLTGFGSLEPDVVTRFVSGAPLSCGWEATFSGQPKGPVGYGSSAEAAEADLIEYMEMRDELQRDRDEANGDGRGQCFQRGR